MAFKLPLFSQNKKETAAQGNDANNAAPTEGSAYAEASAAPNTITPVSYTHLTLPTSDLV